MYSEPFFVAILIVSNGTFFASKSGNAFCVAFVLPTNIAFAPCGSSDSFTILKSQSEILSRCSFSSFAEYCSAFVGVSDITICKQALLFSESFTASLVESTPLHAQKESAIAQKQNTVLTHLDINFFI